MRNFKRMDPLPLTERPWFWPLLTLACALAVIAIFK